MKRLEFGIRYRDVLFIINRSGTVNIGNILRILVNISIVNNVRKNANVSRVQCKKVT